MQLFVMQNVGRTMHLMMWSIFILFFFPKVESDQQDPFKQVTFQLKLIV